MSKSVIYYDSIKQHIPSREVLCPSSAYLFHGDHLAFLPTYVGEVQLDWQYMILLSGVLLNGAKINVLLTDIMPYFEVQSPSIFIEGLYDKEESENIANALMHAIRTVFTELLTIKGMKPHIKTEIVEGKPFKYYQEHTSYFIRFSFKQLHQRKKCMTKLKEFTYGTFIISPEDDSIEMLPKHSDRIVTTANDESCYYRVVARNYLISYNTWSELTEYDLYDHIDLAQDIKTICVSIYNFKTASAPPTLQDKTLSLCWDIETYSRSGAVPLPNDEGTNIVCIGMTFQFIHEKPIHKICICDLPSSARDDYVTVVCVDSDFDMKKTERNMLVAFYEVIQLFRPEFILGFNDGEYDWPWIIERGKAYPELLTELGNALSIISQYPKMSDDVLYTRHYRLENIKTGSGTDVNSKILYLPGYIPVDVRTCFRRLYPFEEQSSLKFYLAECRLDGKENMAYERLFAIYRAYITLVESGKVKFNISTLEIEYVDAQNASDALDKIMYEFSEVCHYCIVDAFKCHELMSVKSVILNNREVGHMSYVSLYDTFYRADGMKVRNLTIAKGQQPPFNIHFSNTSSDASEKGQYPGAFVIPPKKGMQTSKLSIIERMKKGSDPFWKNEFDNISSADVVARLQNVKAIIQEHGPCVSDSNVIGHLPVAYQEFFKERIGRPVVGLDFSSLYPSLIRTYNLSPEYCIKNETFKNLIHNRERANGKQGTIPVQFEYNDRMRSAWFIWHNNKTDIDKPDFQFGIYPYILDWLFSYRVVLKEKLAELKVHKEELAKDGKIKTNEYEELELQIKSLDGKQGAVKRFMNTFYGESGNKISPFFILELAGGITDYGKRNLVMVYNYITEQGCYILYGDTDSIYMSVPDRHFIDIDKEYYANAMPIMQDATSVVQQATNTQDATPIMQQEINTQYVTIKHAYWTRMIEITYKQANIIRNNVNSIFENKLVVVDKHGKSEMLDVGTRFLSMAYEEVLYNVIFLAKKKYYGIEHKKFVNFKPKELFIRGLEVKKRGVSDLLRKIFTEIMWESMDVNNLYEPLELAIAKVDELYRTKWTLEDFVQTAIYKPPKKDKPGNVKVNTFVARMAEQGIVVAPYERFSYVIVKKYPYKYNMRGCTEALKVGDKMEFYENAKKNGDEIDIDYYVLHSVVGQLARLIAYHKDFQVEISDYDNNDIVKRAEDKIYGNAKKYISKYCEKYFTRYNKLGDTYQKVFRILNKNAKTLLTPKYGSLYSTILTSNVDISELESWLKNEANKLAEKSILANYGKYIINKQLCQRQNIIKQSIICSDMFDNVSDQSVIKAYIKNRIIKYRYQIAEAYYGRKGLKEFTEDRLYHNFVLLHAELVKGKHEYANIFNKYRNALLQVINDVKSNIDVQDYMKPINDSTLHINMPDIETDEDISNVLNNINKTIEIDINENDIISRCPAIADMDYSGLHNLITLLIKYKAVYMMQHKVCKIVDYLKECKMVETNILETPKCINAVIETDTNSFHNSCKDIHNMRPVIEIFDE